jgi:epoxyqueuosine reductase
MQVEERRRLSGRLKERARELGFELAGITTPDPPPHLGVYARWLESGHHAGMNYLATPRARSRRADPLQILPECRSILVVGVNYTPSGSAPPIAGAQIAAYAVGDDYHDWIPARVEKLVAFLETELGRKIPNRIYTDTGPILERELAQRAGLGWIGKNTCLINPMAGSYFLLAEVFLGIELEPDAPHHTDQCGSCTRCIEACPTACILPNRTLDARHCISYLTIEEKGQIPPELRPSLGTWAFGCDICQQVCPWNRRFAQPTDKPEFQPSQFVQGDVLPTLLELPVKGWRSFLAGSPLARPKRRGLVRNAAIIAANTRARGRLPQLLRLLRSDPDPVVRAHAAWALSCFQDVRAIESLRQQQTREQDQGVIDEIEAALGAASAGQERMTWDS